MIISRYGAHFWNEEIGAHFWNEKIEAFSHHPDLLFGIVPCVYAILIVSVHLAPMNAILF